MPLIPYPPVQVNLLLSKWMKELEKIFYGNIVAYDAALGKHDDMQLVIWRYGISRKYIALFCTLSPDIPS